MWSNAGRFLRANERQNRTQARPLSEPSEGEGAEGFASEESDESADSSSDERSNRGNSIVEQPPGTIDSPCTLLLTRRSAAFGVTDEDCDTNFADRDRVGEGSRNISVIQNLWSEYAREAGSLYPPALWSILHAVLGVPKTTQSKVLKVSIM